MLSAPWVLGFPLVIGGCSAPEFDPPSELSGSVESELSESGIERVIPIHFALLKRSSTGAKLSLAEMQAMVRDANFVFRPAGVQFYISAIDEYVTPSLWDMRYRGVAHPEVSWAAVANDIRKIFPGAPTTLTSPSTRIVMDWLDVASSNWGPKDEIFISVGELGSSCHGIEPWMGRGFASGKDVLSDTGTFAHELGHYLGLPHNWELPKDPWGNTPVDPETGAAVTMDDFWDLIYGYENPPRFFTSRDEAVAYTGSKRRKDKQGADGGEGGYCTEDSTCSVTCQLDVPGGTVSVRTGEPGAEGMSYIFAGDAPGNPVRGVNIEVYFGDPSCVKYNSISTSQARMIRKHLRFRTTQSSNSWAVANGQPQPTYRDLLGKWTGNQSLASKLDFDGDGKRDLAVFRPPSTPGGAGQFLIRKSSSSPPYSVVTTVTFGTLGDVPIPADYDGDGKTDLAVWRTMGPLGDDPTDRRGLWLWCASSNNATCSTAPSPIYWGERSDIPLPGTNFDGNAATGELAVYRPNPPSFHQWISPFSSGTGTTYNFATASSEAIPLVGLYDADAKTDLVAYSPSSTTFSYALSGAAWLTESTRSFGLGPGSSGGPGLQRAPFPVPTYTSGGRQVFSIWDPNTGLYHTMWTPFSSSTDSTCWWGAPSDVPVGTSIDRNGDGHGDRLIRRNDGAAPTVTYFFDSAFATCNGNSLGRTITGLSPRAFVFSAMDGSGDGKPDLWTFDPDSMMWGYLTSQSDFAIGVGTFQLGKAKDLPL